MTDKQTESNVQAQAKREQARRYRVETASESIVIFDEVTSVRFDKELGTVAFFDAGETLVGLVPIGKLDNLALQIERGGLNDGSN